MQTIAEMQKEHLTLKSTKGSYRCSTHDYSRPAQNLVKKRDLLIVLGLKFKYRNYKSDTSHKFKSSKLYKYKHGIDYYSTVDTLTPRLSSPPSRGQSWPSMYFLWRFTQIVSVLSCVLQLNIHHIPLTRVLGSLKNENIIRSITGPLERFTETKNEEELNKNPWTYCRAM